MSMPRLLTVLAATALATAGARAGEPKWKSHAVNAKSEFETAGVFDVDGDGKLDIVSGENWYEGPGWIKHKFRSISFADNYIDNFSDLAIDVNGDGSVDIVSCSYFTRKLYWMENPGKGRGAWK